MCSVCQTAFSFPRGFTWPFSYWVKMRPARIFKSWLILVDRSISCMMSRTCIRTRTFSQVAAIYVLEIGPDVSANPEIELRTDLLSVPESVTKILDFLQVQDGATEVSI